MHMPGLDFSFLAEGLELVQEIEHRHSLTGSRLSEQGEMDRVAASENRSKMRAQLPDFPVSDIYLKYFFQNPELLFSVQLFVIEVLPVKDDGMFEKGLYLLFDLGYQLHLISTGNSLSDANVLGYLIFMFFGSAVRVVFQWNSVANLFDVFFSFSLLIFYIENK
jgi:hypothetical protein